MMEIAKPRPPYIRFEIRAVEDRSASVEGGGYRTKDVDFALITPMGSKDTAERIVSEWFAHLEEQVRQERFDSEWLSAYKRAYDNWKHDREDPIDGTPLRSWPVLTPSQVKMLTDLRLRAVEDLAGANEEVIKKLGMGGRALVIKAQDWLKQASGPGKIVEEISALKVKNEQLTEQNAGLLAKVTELANQVLALSKVAA